MREREEKKPNILHLRVWYGPLPEMLCMVHVKMTQMMYTVLFCLVAYVTIAKFTFICIWKSMRVMNDDLLARIIISQISFICILFWWPFDGHLGSEVSKGVSDLKAFLDYCEDLARNCENLNCCFPAQTKLFN